MPCINVKVRQYAEGEVALQDVIALVMAATSATAAPFIKRDISAEGKLNRGMICFFKGTISKADLVIARAICNGHNDIVFGVQFPLDFQDDIEALTPGDPILLNKLLGNPTSSEIPFATTSPDDAEAGLRISATDKGTGGSGLALEVKDLDTTTSTTQHNIQGIVALNVVDVPDISDFIAWKLSFDHKRAITWTVPGDTPDRTSNVIALKSQSLMGNQVTIRISDVGTKPYIFQYRDSMNVAQSIVTSVLWDGNYKHMSLEMKNDGTWTFDLDNGAFTHTEDLGLTIPTPDLRIQAAVQDKYSVAQTVDQEPMYLDNILFTINEGTLI